MKIINMLGGLGNQMFEYAFALALKKHYPGEEILLDIHHLKTLYDYGFELKTVFPDIDYQLASKTQIRKVSRYLPNYKASRIVRRLLPPRKCEYVERKQDVFDPNVFKQNGDVYFEGYWHAYEYYQDILDEIQDAFTQKKPNEYNQSMAQRISASNTVGIHVRRGDYLKAQNAKFSQSCGKDYYAKAIALLKESGKDYHYYFFSNDMEWCENEIVPLLNPSDYTFVTENKGINSCWDMYLMSQCENLIIANSSFSWWGALLNKRTPNVYAPKMWKIGVPSDSICPLEWTLI